MSKQRREPRHLLPAFAFPPLPQLSVEQLPVKLPPFPTGEEHGKALGTVLGRLCALLRAAGIDPVELGDNLMPLHGLLAQTHPGLRIETRKPGGSDSALDALDLFSLIHAMALEGERGGKRYDSRVCKQVAKARGLKADRLREIWSGEIKPVMRAAVEPDKLTAVQQTYLFHVEPIVRGEHLSRNALMSRYRQRFAIAADIKSANLATKTVIQQRD